MPPDSSSSDGNNSPEPRDPGRHDQANALVAELRALKEQLGADAKQQETRHRWTVVTTFGVVIYTVVTAGIAVLGICQLRESHDATVATKRVANIAEDTERRQLRAYLNEDGFKFSCPSCKNPNNTGKIPASADRMITPGNSADITILNLKNFGLTPAINITFTENFKELPPHQTLPMIFSYPDRQIDLPPNMLFNPAPGAAFLGGGQPVEMTYPLSREAISYVINSKYLGRSFFIYGHIDYETVFQQKCSFRYVFFYDHTASPESFVRTDSQNSQEECQEATNPKK